MTDATDVLLPTSPDEAIAAYGDGSGITLVGGGDRHARDLFGADPASGERCCSPGRGSQECRGRTAR